MSMSKQSEWFLKPDFVELEKGKWWESDGDLLFYIADYDYTIYIPKGTDSDLASIPWPFRLMYPKDGKYKWGAFVHDFPYGRQGKLYIIRTSDKEEAIEKAERGEVEVVHISESVADHIFKVVMQVDKLRPTLIRLFHRLVRVFGTYYEIDYEERARRKRLRGRH